MNGASPRALSTPAQHHQPISSSFPHSTLAIHHPRPVLASPIAAAAARPLSEASPASCSGRDMLSPSTSRSSGSNGGIALPRQQRRNGSGSNSVATSAVLTPEAPAPSAAPRPVREEPPILWLGDQRIHSLPNRGLDVIRSLEGWAREDLLKHLKPVERCWQPTDFLPESSSPDFYDEVQAMREMSQCLPLDYLVVLVGDMVTEEALPSYMNMLNLLDGTKDESGADPHPWAEWTRAWTGEENRHGDLLNKYLYLTGRVNMRSIEGTIQRLIGKGMDPQLENNPYLCFVYTSFQERATKISHANTARLAVTHGDPLLGRICSAIANDEARHEVAYMQIVSEILQRDPDGAMLAFSDMMKKGIVMPAHFVDDGWHAEANAGQNLFIDYATVADQLGVYTTRDYAAIVDHLVDRWDIANVRVESGEAAEAQEFLVHHAARIRRLADIQMERRLRDRKRGKIKMASFSWIGKRELPLS